MIWKFVFILDTTKHGRDTSYSKICAYVDLSHPLPASFMLRGEEKVWEKLIDYEHIPFHYHKCHKHGHLLRDFPMNQTQNNVSTVESKDATRFTKVAHKMKIGKRGRMTPSSNISEKQTICSFTTTLRSILSLINVAIALRKIGPNKSTSSLNIKGLNTYIHHPTKWGYIRNMTTNYITSSSQAQWGNQNRLLHDLDTIKEIYDIETKYLEQDL